MPSPPLPRAPASEPRAGGRWAALALLALAVSGCAGVTRPGDAVAVPEEAAGVSSQERPFFIDPTLTYPLLLDAERAVRLRSAYRGLVEEGRDETALAVAGEILEADPGFHPADVLAAQVAAAEGRFQAAAERLRPVTEELPGYAAAQVGYGRALEKLGRVVEAYAAYRRVAATAGAAAARVRELEPRALEILANRLGDALARGRIDAAREHLGRLRTWAPDAEATLEAALALAEAAGNREAELAAVAELSERHPERRDLMERRASLELEVGEVQRGLDLYRELARRHPEDPALAAGLEAAKFRWRLELLPEEVGGLVREPEVSRGEFASLLYWLVPAIRHGRPSSARIAVDILDHPRRDELARVANLGVMEVDATLHRFAPDEPLTRGEALAACIAVLELSEPPPPCLGVPVAGASVEAVCAAAARCRIIDEPASCLPLAAVSGAEAVDWIRRTLGS